MQYLGHQSQDESLRLQSEGPGRLPGGGGEDRDCQGWEDLRTSSESNYAGERYKSPK